MLTLTVKSPKATECKFHWLRALFAAETASVRLTEGLFLLKLPLGVLFN